MRSRSRWRAVKNGDSRGVCTCAACTRAIDAGEDVTCADCAAQAAEIAYADERRDALVERGDDV